MRKAAVVLTALCLAGCHGKSLKPVAAPVPVPVKLRVKFMANEHLNPDIAGRSSPVVVRLYQLTDRSLFDQADFQSLYQREEATLKQTAIFRTEVFMPPGESRLLELELNNATKALGTLAVFRDTNSAHWRDSVMLGQSGITQPSGGARTITFTVTLAESGLSIRETP